MEKKMLKKICVLLAIFAILLTSFISVSVASVAMAVANAPPNDDCLTVKLITESESAGVIMPPINEIGIVTSVAPESRWGTEKIFHPVLNASAAFADPTSYHITTVGIGPSLILTETAGINRFFTGEINMCLISSTNYFHPITGLSLFPVEYEMNAAMPINAQFGRPLKHS